jgi:heterogeneous nuclear ribonucleoprotein F/H
MSDTLPTVTGVLRMRGLPFSATKADVIAFFQGLSIIEDSVQLVVRPDGRLTGEAFVAFPSPADADCAMARNGNNMGSRYVELFPSSPEEAASHPRAL